MKLLICDDDISTVDVIQSQLNCAELGISRVLRAYNGEAAIRIIDGEKPEIIICDIGMPKVSGMEVLKHIHDNRIRTEFCFLTCHEDFSYAVSAIRYGASNYLTKPFDMNELRTEVARMVFSARKKTGEPGGEKQTRNDSVLNSVLRQICDGVAGSSRNSAQSLLTRNGIDISADSMWHMVMSCLDTAEILQGRWSQELLRYTVCRLHDEMLADYVGSAYCLTDSDGRFLNCTCFVPGEKCSAEELRARCEALLSFCKNVIGVRLSVLSGPLFPLYEAAAVRSSMLNSLTGIRVHAGKVFTMEDARTASRERGSFLDANQLLGFLKRSDRAGCLEYTASVAGRIAASGEYTREVMDDFRRELIHVFASCLRDNGLSTQLIFEDGELSRLEPLSVFSGENMLRYTQRLYTLTADALRDLADADDIIARADAYIRQHFRENITREDVAAVACITPNYLSKQFHSRKGMKLREYINQIRIEEAKRLLLTTNLSVSEVAGMTGYDNISYFSTVFRKYTGVSPVDWRSRRCESETN